MRNIKKILIVVSALVVICVLVIVFFMNYDVTIVKGTSDEYKELYNISSIEYYKKNHLLVNEVNSGINSEVVNSDVLYMPDLTLYKNYKPEFIGRYQNVDSGNDNKYIEIYRLYLVDDDFYKHNLKEYFSKWDKAYMKIGINNMNLITSISIKKDMEGEDVYGPIMYEYYHNKK